MTTNEFIKMLQKADPEGTHHVRLRGDGVPYHADLVEGYWDGGYEYFDENGNLIRTYCDAKVDIWTKSFEDIVERYNGNMDEINKRISVDVSDFSAESQGRATVNRYMVKVKKYAKKIRKILREIEQERINKNK